MRHRRSLARRLGCAVLIAAALAPAAAAASSPVVVKHPRFLRVTSTGQGFAAGDYQLVPPTTADAGGLLTNVKTGTRTPVTAPAGCTNFLMSANSLLLKCFSPAASPFLLYSFNSQAERPLSFAGVPDALGTKWAELKQFSDQTAHAAVVYAYQSLTTGQVVADPRRAGGSVTVDLDAPGLTRHVCRPLTVPHASANPTRATPGSLTILGTTGVGIGLYPALSTHAARTVLQRCGSRNRVVIDRMGGELVDSRSLVLWQGAPDRLLGYALPGLRPIEIDIPKRLAGWTTNLALNSRNVYFPSVSGTWSLPLDTVKALSRPSR